MSVRLLFAGFLVCLGTPEKASDISFGRYPKVRVGDKELSDLKGDAVTPACSDFGARSRDSLKADTALTLKAAYQEKKGNNVEIVFFQNTHTPHSGIEVQVPSCVLRVGGDSGPGEQGRNPSCREAPSGALFLRVLSARASWASLPQRVLPPDRNPRGNPSPLLRAAEQPGFCWSPEPWLSRRARVGGETEELAPGQAWASSGTGALPPSRHPRSRACCRRCPAPSPASSPAISHRLRQL